MKTFYQKESFCEQAFFQLGTCFHLWTSENFEIIFRTTEDFKAGMTIFGICTLLFPDIRILTFELMSNHIHIVAVGNKNRIVEMFQLYRHLLKRHFQDRTVNWKDFKENMRQLNSLDDVRNVIVYNNRNGYVVNDDYSPYSYPWGANSYYFNLWAKSCYNIAGKPISVKERRDLCHSHIPDDLDGLMGIDGYACPLSFCDIAAGEQLFRDASHYFYKIGKNIEQNKEIAKEIGEAIYYTDDELYSALRALSSKQYGTNNLSILAKEQKMDLAKTMHYDFNASLKQIQRFLKLPESLISNLFH